MEEVMPSRRHSSAMLSSPRKPSSTMRILSSAEKWRRVARRMSLTTASAGALAGPDVWFIVAPQGYDEPEILRSRDPSVCLTNADAGQDAPAKKVNPALMKPLQPSKELAAVVGSKPLPRPEATSRSLASVRSLAT